MVFDHWTPCDLDFLVCGRISLWESQEGPTFPIKNILTCHQSWFLDGVGVISFFWRGSWSPPGLDIKPWLGVFLHGCCCCWSLLCVSLTTAITNYCPQGERHPLQDCPFCLFTSPFISLSRYPLRLPMCVCVWGGVSADIARREKGHALVPSISPHLHPSLLQDSVRLANQIPSFIHFLT